MMTRASNKQLYCWDFTLFLRVTREEQEEEENEHSSFKTGDHSLIKKQLREICKGGTFQLEEGEKSKKLHYQGRISLKKKRRKSEIVKLATTTFLKGIHWSPTSNANKGNHDYVTKEHTRIEGPWDLNELESYVPRQIRAIKELRPFQRYIIEDAQVWNTRTINVVLNPEGCVGKSILKGWLRAYKIGRPLPAINDFKDIMRMVMDMPTSSLYLMDMPKAMKKDKLGGMYAAIETIKDGYAWDDRYSFKEKVFDCPNIWIFTNTAPDMDLLSRDRWKIWGVTTDTYELYPWVEATKCDSDGDAYT